MLTLYARPPLARKTFMPERRALHLFRPDAIVSDEARNVLPKTTMIVRVLLQITNHSVCAIPLPMPHQACVFFLVASKSHHLIHTQHMILPCNGTNHPGYCTVFQLTFHSALLFLKEHISIKHYPAMEEFQEVFKRQCELDDPLVVDNGPFSPSPHWPTRIEDVPNT